MPDLSCLEPAIDPANRSSFLLDWEITMKCNLDCDYCPKGVHGGHDNTTNHPDLSSCLDTVDFMFEYVDIYMQRKPKALKHVILNVYGGESLHHPKIVDILSAVREKYFKKNYDQAWHLTVTTTTNAIVASKKLAKIIPLIDEFTVSYHTNNTHKQKLLFCSNILEIQKAGRRVKCVILMHPEPDLFSDAQNMIEWCKRHDVSFLPRQLDRAPIQNQFDYTTKQVHWFGQLYNSRSDKKTMPTLQVQKDADNVNLTDIGRACCGGRLFVTNQDKSNREYFVNNRFPDWYCSVNEFFVYIKQVNGEIYTNRDCKMNFNNSVGAIGNLNEKTALLDLTKRYLDHSLRPIQCKKNQCMCGLCAPKAKELSMFNHVMEKYRK